MPTNWHNVRWILFREVRDQLRDRRTLFMIAVLPLLLYPLLGMSLFQVAQFVRGQPTRVVLVGHHYLPASPPLVESLGTEPPRDAETPRLVTRFAAEWFDSPAKAELIEVELVDVWPATPERLAECLSEARARLADGEAEAVVYFPADFRARFDAFRTALRARAAPGASTPPGGAKAVAAPQPSADDAAPAVPSPELFYNAAKEKSQLAYLRLSQVLDRWTEQIGRENLATTNLPESTVQPFRVESHDLAEEGHRDAALWAKVLPFLLLIWALTGAFYPAIDLCAGEKERGTLETLLASPAERGEIVWGKLLTIMLFSVATAVLNILSIAVTAGVVVKQLPQLPLGPPPALAPLWLAVALVPMAALFSALCLALAALARGTKEGQYYLMPVVMVAMPLVVLPMSPGVELNLANSLIPLSGVVLLLRQLMEGNVLAALPYFPPVILVTFACCLAAVRWAVDQFNSEAVLFRDGERFDVGLWLRHVHRDRSDTPTVAAALFCGVLILVLRFFLGSAAQMPQSFGDLARLTLATQLAVILMPALAMTLVVTRRWAETLSLRVPRWWTVPAAALLALALHPVVTWFGGVVQTWYPAPAELSRALAGLIDARTPAWQLVLFLAVVPAVCEELAYRGFILSGLRRSGHTGRAIALAALLFAAAHGILQQSIVAFGVGLVIGYVAVQTGSLWPAIAYHVTHNATALLAGRYLDDLAIRYGLPPWLVELGPDPQAGGVPSYGVVVIVAGAAVAAGILAALRGLPFARSEEEELAQLVDRVEQRPTQAPAAR